MNLCNLQFVNDLKKTLSSAYETISPQNRGLQEFQINLSIKPEWSFFQGHFPGKPILPAYAITEISTYFINLLFENKDFSNFKILETLRMKYPVRPFDEVKININKDSEYSEDKNMYHVKWHSHDMTKTLILATFQMKENE